jgi:hypothetical protein
MRLPNRKATAAGLRTTSGRPTDVRLASTKGAVAERYSAFRSDYRRTSERSCPSVHPLERGRCDDSADTVVLALTARGSCRLWKRREDEAAPHPVEHEIESAHRAPVDHGSARLWIVMRDGRFAGGALPRNGHDDLWATEQHYARATEGSVSQRTKTAYR